MISKHCATEFEPTCVDYVYSLRSPLDYNVFYVGRTITPKIRLQAHSTDYNALAVNYGKRGVIQKIREADRLPIMRFIDKTEIRTRIDYWEADFKEIYWIQKYKEYGWNLMNIRDIDRNLLTMEYYSKYLQLKIDKQRIPLEYYHAFNRRGYDVYDRRRRKKDGFWIPVTKNEDDELFNSMADGCDDRHWRWYSKIDKPMGYISYDNCYNDTNPNIYPSDY